MEAHMWIRLDKLEMLVIVEASRSCFHLLIIIIILLCVLFYFILVLLFLSVCVCFVLFYSICSYYSVGAQ